MIPHQTYHHATFTQMGDKTDIILSGLFDILQGVFILGVGWGVGGYV
jgi:hypothetical protein